MTLGASLIATGAALLVERAVSSGQVLVDAITVLGTFGVVYITTVVVLKHPDALQIFRLRAPEASN